MRRTYAEHRHAARMGTLGWRGSLLWDGAPWDSRASDTSIGTLQADGTGRHGLTRSGLGLIRACRGRQRTRYGSRHGMEGKDTSSQGQAGGRAAVPEDYPV
jgi:hypothetical protein